MPGPMFAGGSPGKDTWDIEILPDGRIKITTGPTSPAIHTSAERLLADVTNAMGGEVTRVRRPGARHDHGHNHDQGRSRQ